MTAYEDVASKRLARKVALRQMANFLQSDERCALTAALEDADSSVVQEVEDMELSFDVPVEIYVDCPEKMGNTTGVKCLFLMEPEVVSGARRRSKGFKFDFVFGRGESDIFFAFGGTWVPEFLRLSAPKKEFFCSMICGDKSATLGHRLRRRVFDKIKNVERFASSRSPMAKTNVQVLSSDISAKAKVALAPFRFHIAVENVSETNYFSEKIIDCFLLRTIPIYWGCPNIADFFDPDGIIHVKDEEDLLDTVHKLFENNESVYAAKASAINNNFNKAHDYIDLKARMQAVIDTALSSSS